MKKLLLILLLCFLPLLQVPAQIFSHGSDPGNLRWWTLETPHYELLYPTGLDSLARRYGLYLEQYREATGRSAGMTPGQFQWKKRTPVVLHPYNGFSNGSMMYAPVRMDLFTRIPRPGTCRFRSTNPGIWRSSRPDGGSHGLSTGLSANSGPRRYGAYIPTRRSPKGMPWPLKRP